MMRDHATYPSTFLTSLYVLRTGSGVRDVREGDDDYIKNAGKEQNLVGKNGIRKKMRECYTDCHNDQL